jgi:PleD family two-component response regulator
MVTVSLGVATAWPSTPHGARGLIEAADQNLYAAKRDGRNRVSTGARVSLSHAQA